MAPPGPGGATGTITATSVYTPDGGKAAFSDRLFTADETDEMAVLAKNARVLRLLHPKVVTSGSTESADDSSIRGLNATVRVTGEASGIGSRGGDVTTTGSGATALHAHYAGSVTMAGGGSTSAGRSCAPSSSATTPAPSCETSPWPPPPAMVRPSRPTGATARSRCTADG
ncbi:hypothetical protein ACQEWB_48750 [Streptomyces sp. CA-249302]|uniref:hypothetical protein n=1 Tax=Streptomyces sp. CA-249302 TaxID=3240058 RepID=UPI003D92C706